MTLSRTFVSFSSTDINSFRLMQAWKANTRIDFNFADLQLSSEINSENENYIKSKCRERINMAGTLAVIIGIDTRYKYRYVRWEIEVAREKQCRLIGINLDGSRTINVDTCPPIMRDAGAIFVPFSPRIVSYALSNWKGATSENWHFNPEVYKNLGYNT